MQPSVGVPTRERRRELGVRLLTASVAIPATLACAIAGGVWFKGFVFVIALMAAAELALLLPPGNRVASVGVACLAAAAFPISVAIGRGEVAWWLLGAATVAGLAFAVSTELDVRRVPDAADGKPVPLPRTGGGEITRWALALAGGLYVGTLLAPGIALRERPDGLAWVALILAGTWACDSAAYVVGRRWGRHRFASAISPNKSLEGVAGGLLACVAVAAAGAGALGVNVPRAIGLGLVVGLASVLGDLVESSLKRSLGAKDSGWIMPGHGGMLDRIDSLLFSGFLGYLYITGTDGMFYA